MSKPSSMTPEERKAWNEIEKRKVKVKVEQEPPLEWFERGDEVELGRYLAGKIGKEGAVVYTEGRIWVAEGLTWTEYNDERLSRIVQDFAGSYVRVQRKDDDDTWRPLNLSSSNVSGIIKQAKAYLYDEAFFSSAPVGAAFASTFASIQNGRVVAEPLTPAHRVKATHAATYALPTESSEPARVLKFLHEIWAGCADVEERIQYLMEWGGAALMGRATQYKDTPLVVGEKDTGKSVLLNLIATMFPATSHRSVPLHAMSSDYHRAHLSGGRINFVNELPSRELLDGEAAKAILSGDKVSCRRPHENCFDWLPRCAHVMAANELPPSRDPALMDRLVVLDCPNVVPREKQDRGLTDALVAEVPQLALLMLLSLQALLDRGSIVRPASSDTNRLEWRAQSDPVYAWRLARLTLTTDGTYMTGDDLYREFCFWAEQNGHTRMASNRFGIRLKSLVACRKVSVMRYYVELKPHEVASRDVYGKPLKRVG